MLKDMEVSVGQNSVIAAQSVDPADRMEYNPSNLLDALLVHLDLKNDAALARALEVAPPLLSKLRHRTLPVGGAVLIRMHEVSGLSIAELRILLGDSRQKFRISDKHFKPKAKGQLQSL
jgi:hypothetical protein